MEGDFKKDCDDDDDALPKGQERRTRVGWQQHQPAATNPLLRAISKTSCVVEQVLPSGVVEIGSRAQRLAKRKKSKSGRNLRS
jgi:hypothetical protein